MSSKDIHLASDFKKRILEIKTTTPMRHLRNRRSLCSTNFTKQTVDGDINMDISSEMLTPKSQSKMTSKPISQQPRIEEESINWNAK